MDKLSSRDICNAIVDTVRESELSGFGAPLGILYAGLMTAGVTLDSFNMYVDMCQNRAGLVRRDGDCLTLTDKARDIYMRANIPVSAGKMFANRHSA